MFGHFSGKETDKKLHKNVRLERTSEGVGNGMLRHVRASCYTSLFVCSSFFVCFLFVYLLLEFFQLLERSHAPSLTYFAAKKSSKQRAE